MYVSQSSLRIDPKRSEELITAFRHRARLVEDADGFVDLQVWQNDRATTSSPSDARSRSPRRDAAPGDGHHAQRLAGARHQAGASAR